MPGRQTRREFLAKVAAAAGAAVAARGCAPSEEGQATMLQRAKRPSDGAQGRPNILFILADDLGYGDLGCCGSADIRTPHVDRLAAEGVRFTHYYAAGSECTPTRTALFTGRYLQRVGGLECAIGTTNVGRYDDAIRLAERHDLGLPVEQADLTGALKAAGYAMAVYGKWHLGYERKFLPLRHGFEHFVGILGGHCDYFHHCEITGTHTLHENDRPIRRDEYMTDLITGESVRFLRRQDGHRPFFLYVSYTAPHSPYQGPNDRRPKPVPQEQWNQGTRAKYAEMTQHMDRGIGQILAVLGEKRLADQTLVIFASDNGAERAGSNAPLSGHKGGLYEGGIRVPCIARWPGVLPRGAACEQPSITMDLTASMIRAAGGGPPKDRALDGVDVLGLIARSQGLPKRPLFWRARRGERTWRAVRDGTLKYLSRQDGQKLQEWLFDLAADPAEKNDLLAERSDDAERLRRLLAEWQREVKAPRPT